MCDFPARQLLRLRRDLPINLPLDSALPLISQIDAMRWSHEERTKCKCWDAAREEIPNRVGDVHEVWT
jgi:hypothetical protein